MRARSWVEFKGRRKIAVFVVAVLVAVVFVSCLPTRAWTRGIGRSSLPMPVAMLLAWIGGWFVALFLRAEDLTVLAPFDFQQLYRWAGMAAATLGLYYAGMLYLAYLAD